MTSESPKPQPIAPHIDIEMSEDARAFMAISATPGPMPMIEDAYSIKGKTNWFVVYTLPNIEKKVDAALRASGINAYLPLCADWRKQSRREKHMAAAKVRVERPLLSRYLFVELPVFNPPFASLFSIYGVREVLREPGSLEYRPIPIPADIIEKLRAKQDSGAFDATVKKGKMFIPKWAVGGTQVRVKDGPLGQFQAMIVKVLPNDKIQLEREMFGRTTRFEMPIGNVEAA